MQTCIFPFPKVLCPMRIARPLSWSAPASISLALALSSFTCNEWKIFQSNPGTSYEDTVIFKYPIRPKEVDDEFPIVELQHIKVLILTRTTSGLCVIACPSTIWIGIKLPFLSIVLTRVSVPSSHIWATSSPALTKPPCSIVKRERSKWWTSKLYIIKIEYRGLTGLFRKSNMYDWTPRFSIS